MSNKFNIVYIKTCAKVLLEVAPLDLKSLALAVAPLDLEVSSMH